MCRKLEAARSTAKERAELEQLTRTHELELQSQATLTTKISELQERRAVLDNRRDNLLGRLEATNKAMQDARLQHQELAVAKEEARLEFEQLLCVTASRHWYYCLARALIIYHVCRMRDQCQEGGPAGAHRDGAERVA